MNDRRAFFSIPKINEIFHLTAFVMITPFGLWMINQGQLIWGALVMLASLAIAISFFLISSLSLQLLGRFIAVVIPCGVVLAFLTEFPEYAMLWSFPMVVYFYYQLNLTLAAVFNVLFLAAALAIIDETVPLEIITRFGAAHLILGIFSAAFAFDRRTKENELQRLAHLDELTGLPNRRRLMTQLSLWSEHAERYKEQGVILFIDIDNFKQINDTYGHHMGDEVLQEVARLLLKRVRKTDLIGRLGGEEFLILLDHIELPEAEALANELLVLAHEHKLAHGRSIDLSIGAALFNPGESIDAWIRRADEAMYQAKHAGGHTIRIAD